MEPVKHNLNNFNQFLLSKEYNIYKLVGLFILGFVTLYGLLYSLDIIKEIPRVGNTARWDAGWYKRIVRDGYSYDPNGQCSVAFFPLFPLLWKLLHANSLTISFVNTFIYFTGVIIFLKNYKPHLIKVLFLLSAPTLMFCYLAFSEALFFLFSTLIFIGLDKKKLWLLVLGVIGCGLTRSAIVVFLPAFLFLWVMTYKKDETKLWKHLVILLTLALTILIVVYIQWIDTGHWFVFSDPQKHWGHKLTAPSYPFTTDHKLPIFTDLLSITIGILCTIEVLILFLNKINLLKNRNLNNITSSEYFALGYSTAIGLFILLFQDSNLHSINRYIFGTVYFWAFCFYFWKNQKSLGDILLRIAPVILVYAGMVDGRGQFHEGFFSYFRFITMTTILVLPMVLNLEKKKNHILLAGCIFVCACLQMHYYHLYLTGQWIG